MNEYLNSQLLKMEMAFYLCYFIKHLNDVITFVFVFLFLLCVIYESIIASSR